MANTEHLAILKKGVKRWNKWLTDHPETRPDLRGADLSAAEIPWSDLSGASMDTVDLSGANIAGADLSGADLTGANLSRANIAAANFRWAKVARADFTGALAGETTFANIDLGEAIGLVSVRHLWPSTIGIDTIYKSGGKIPSMFLRGCGLPDEFISYVGSMVGRTIEFYSCFVSYSTKDQQFADRLYADLQSKGVRCWFAPHDVQGGRKLHDQIDEAIHLHDKLLLILSPKSIASEWVRTEISKARRREMREGKRVLFPVRLVPFEVLRDWECFDADAGTDSAREIREYFIPDFTNWKDHDSYQSAFERLVNDLKQT